VTALFDINTYTVTFVSEGQTISTQSIQYLNDALTPSNPTKVGYTFKGWDQSFEDITKDITVTALFDINTYTVIFKSEGQTISTQSIQYLNDALAPSNPTKVGHTFKGWDQSFEDITKDITVTALFDINTYTVTFVSEGQTISTQSINY
jgi:uncharacterized repeat protein (TIGR02543 family)